MSARRGVVIALVLLVLFAPLAAPAASATSVTGAPSLASAYLVGGGSALVFVGAESWTAVWQTEANGSQIYTNQLILLAFDLRQTNVSLVVDAFQSGHGWVDNQSVSLQPLQEVQVLVTFANDPNWQGVVVLMDGTPFVAQVATPISLLPPSIFNVGGLDILALGIVSEGIVVFAGLISLAKVLMRRAKWAPKFSLLVWGHVVVVGIAAAVILDFEWVDRTFAGWSPLVYVFAVAPMIFLYSLSLFNETEKAELLQRVAKPHGRILYRRWLLRFATLADGRVVLIWETWRGWLARLFGHHVVIDTGEENVPDVFEGDIRIEASPSRTRGSVRLSDRWKVGNPQEDQVSRLWWTETGDPVTVTWPHLTIHRLKDVPRKTSPEGAVIREAYQKKVLTWPHYSEPHVELHRALEDYRVVEAVSAEWASVRDLYRVLSKVKTDLYTTKANFSANVEAEVEARLLAYYSLLGKTSADMTDEEAEEEARRTTRAPSLAELLDENRLRPSGKTPKGEGA